MNSFTCNCNKSTAAVNYWSVIEYQKKSSEQTMVTDKDREKPLLSTSNVVTQNMNKMTIDLVKIIQCML